MIDFDMIRKGVIDDKVDGDDKVDTISTIFVTVFVTFWHRK